MHASSRSRAASAAEGRRARCVRVVLEPRRTRGWVTLAGLALLVAGCAHSAGAPTAAGPASSAPPATPGPAESTAASESAAPSSASPASPAPAPPELDSEACGPFECRRFATGSEPLARVLADGPLALGIGEAHALAGSEAAASTTRRFTDELLPSLAGRTSHLVVELLNPDRRCEALTREVRKEQQPVTAPQSAQNQSDYVELGQRARALGIEPFVLSPTCDEFRAIVDAGVSAIDVMLQTIARVTSRMLRGALAKNQAAGREALVVAYGGLLHNDIDPSGAKERWSYGPDLAQFTRGRYVELDLIVREFIKDTEVWRALPWYPHFEPNRFDDQWLLMKTGPQRYTLFFPRSPSATPSMPPPSSSSR
jgi:hypothetical protein